MTKLSDMPNIGKELEKQLKKSRSGNAWTVNRIRKQGSISAD